MGMLESLICAPCYKYDVPVNTIIINLVNSLLQAFHSSRFNDYKKHKYLYYRSFMRAG